MSIPWCTVLAKQFIKFVNKCIHLMIFSTSTHTYLVRHNFSPLRKALRRLQPRCIAQKFSMISPIASKVSLPNFSRSASMCCSMSLLNRFCMAAESDNDDLTKVQLILLEFGIFSTCGISRNFCSSPEISSIILSPVPSGISLTETKIVDNS